MTIRTTPSTAFSRIDLRRCSASSAVNHIMRGWDRSATRATPAEKHAASETTITTKAVPNAIGSRRLTLKNMQPAFAGCHLIIVPSTSWSAAIQHNADPMPVNPSRPEVELVPHQHLLDTKGIRMACRVPGGGEVQAICACSQAGGLEVEDVAPTWTQSRVVAEVQVRI